jgi:hypothetical protein
LIVGLRRLLGDGRRLVAGSVAFMSSLLTRDIVGLGLGQFSAESPLAVTGRPTRYVVSIANAGSEPSDVTLCIEIRPAEAPAPGDAFYARFSKHLKAAPRTSTRVDVHYDWLAAAEFLAGDASSPPDDFRRGTREACARYAISAALLDPAEQVLERLTVYQELLE